MVAMETSTLIPTDICNTIHPTTVPTPAQHPGGHVFDGLIRIGLRGAYAELLNLKAPSKCPRIGRLPSSDTAFRQTLPDAELAPPRLLGPENTQA